MGDDASVRAAGTSTVSSVSTQEPPEPRLPPTSEPTSETAEGTLSELEKSVLAFAALHWKYPGAMETRILEEFGWSATRYFQVLNALLDRPAAHAHDPMLVARLIRLREVRRARRRPRPEGTQEG